MEQTKGDDETLDSFYFGRIKILQKKQGYRFSVDAPLLADFIQTQAQDRLLELGTGTGIISLLLSIKSFSSITALEIQSSLFDLAQKNVRLNHLEDKICVCRADLKTYKSAEKFDVIFSNPPYHGKDTGHISESREKAIAKHELKCDIFAVMSKTAELLKPEGRSYFIFSVYRRAAFGKALEMAGLKISSERSIFPRRGKEANFFMTECVFTGEKKVVLPPLILYDEDGNYTSEVQAIFRGRTNAVSG